MMQADAYGPLHLPPPPVAADLPIALSNRPQRHTSRLFHTPGRTTAAARGPASATLAHSVKWHMCCTARALVATGTEVTCRESGTDAGPAKQKVPVEKPAGSVTQGTAAVCLKEVGPLTTGFRQQSNSSRG